MLSISMKVQSLLQTNVCLLYQPATCLCYITKQNILLLPKIIYVSYRTLQKISMLCVHLLHVLHLLFHCINFIMCSSVCVYVCVFVCVFVCVCMHVCVCVCKCMRIVCTCMHIICATPSQLAIYSAIVQASFHTITRVIT